MLRKRGKKGGKEMIASVLAYWSSVPTSGRRRPRCSAARASMQAAARGGRREGDLGAESELHECRIDTSSADELANEVEFFQRRLEPSLYGARTREIVVRSLVQDHSGCGLWQSALGRRHPVTCAQSRGLCRRRQASFPHQLVEPPGQDKRCARIAGGAPRPHRAHASECARRCPACEPRREQAAGGRRRCPDACEPRHRPQPSCSQRGAAALHSVFL
jgi:hypothetical protein